MGLWCETRQTLYSKLERAYVIDYAGCLKCDKTIIEIEMSSEFGAKSGKVVKRA